jgi:crotonobetainyl-CoA:carnitine CoA-transferase CaiB-like acyl-CoA transferase
MAAPIAGALLADYGAEVIKIENPKAPDVTRSWGRADDPKRTADATLQQTEEGGGSSFVQLNRGKKSVGLNPTSPEGKTILLALLKTADVFITNVRLKSLRKAGLDYETLA